MNLRLPLWAFLATVATASAAQSNPGTPPPGPAASPNQTNPAPQTPAPPQPNGANGTNAKGDAITKAPDSKKKKKGAAPAPATETAAAPTPPPAAPAAPPAPAPVSKTAAVVFDSYLKELSDTLNLSADEKKDIQTYYLTDAATLGTILNDGTLSPLQQATQVADVRDQRDDKIEALLNDPARRHAFFQVEARYRVALTELAAEGGLAPAQPPPPAPAPSDIKPGQAEPIPSTNQGVK